MSGDQLIVSPLSISFQAPMAHFQKRMITMINASDEDVIYRIEIDNAIDYSVIPMRGRVKAFDTCELTLTLVPVIKDIPDCSLVLRSIPLTMIAHKEELEWNSKDILIELDPKKTLRLEDEPMHLQAEALMKRECQPMKKSRSPKSCLRMFLYVLGFFALIMAAYFSFSLMFERIFGVLNQLNYELCKSKTPPQADFKQPPLTVT